MALSPESLCSQRSSGFRLDCPIPDVSVMSEFCTFPSDGCSSPVGQENGAVSTVSSCSVPVSIFLEGEQARRSVVDRMCVVIIFYKFIGDEKI